MSEAMSNGETNEPSTITEHNATIHPELDKACVASDKWDCLLTYEEFKAIFHHVLLELNNNERNLFDKIFDKWHTDNVSTEVLGVLQRIYNEYQLYIWVSTPVTEITRICNKKLFHYLNDNSKYPVDI